MSTISNNKSSYSLVALRTLPGKDDIRNKFFTDGNWIVIRFSEKQVVKYPYRCCKIIAKVVAEVAGDYTFLNKLKNVPSLPPDAMWTIKQAKK
ncbi:MAG: hypothetical protein QNJ47_18490 [Nostocaceae cyanobacterium]|nr:hypothetical protein [Nostocaceae cyanobacterium]